MIQRRNHSVETLYLNRLEDYLTGEIELPASRLNKRPPGIHQSDLNDNSCILKGYYANTLEELPPMGVESVLRFAVGRATERAVAFAGELEPIEKDGIWVTPDDRHPEIGITEIKYTTYSSLSDVSKDFPQWICQMKNQAYVFEEDHVNLVVVYAVGNMPSYTFWGRKDLQKDTVYQGITLRAWTFEFTEEELKMNWLKMMDRKELLERAITDEVPIHRDVVLRELPSNLRKTGRNYWMCKKCNYDMCYLKKELIK